MKQSKMRADLLFRGEDRLSLYSRVTRKERRHKTENNTRDWMKGEKRRNVFVNVTKFFDSKIEERERIV